MRFFDALLNIFQKYLFRSYRHILPTLKVNTAWNRVEIIHKRYKYVTTNIYATVLKMHLMYNVKL